MCGIAGLICEFTPEDDRKAIVGSMNNSLTHRGPDDSGIYSDSGITMGHRRLAIIDLHAGHQPMSFQSYHIVFNGEIYNYREVRDELKSLGHSFLTDSDTEVILHAFSQWGTHCVTRLNGMFAFALWDSKKKDLHLFRDRTGIKPLYYCRFHSGLAFSSEISALFAVKEVSREASRKTLSQFFMFGYPPGPNTAFKNIFELPPASWSHFDGKSDPVPTNYWTPTDAQPFQGSFDEAKTVLDSLLHQVVKEHLVSDVPVSTFLSGGIDSSSITALSQKLYSGTIEAFTVSFPDAKYDESVWAKMVAEHCNVKHTVMDMDQKPATIEDIETIIQHLGQPFADSSCIPTYYVCKAASENYKVVLSGDGADELFYGYENFDFYSKIITLKKIPLLIRQLSSSCIKQIPDYHAINEKLRQLEKALRYSYLCEDDAIIYLNAILDPQQLRDIFSESLSEQLPNDFSHLITNNQDDSPLRKMIKFLFGQSLPQNMLRKVDRMSMRSSLEVRVPFLDHRVIEFAYSLPKEFTIHNGLRKYILRKVMSKYLPEKVFTHKKQGFDIPLHRYYTKSFMDGSEDLLLSSDSAIRLIMGEDKISSVIKANRALMASPKRYYSNYTWSHLLWMMLQFEIWKNKFNVSF